MPPEVAVDEGTPPCRSLPPVRKTLERLLATYRQPRNDPSLPWELRAVPDFAREQAADNLQSYLAASLAAQSVAWTLRPPDGMSGRFPVTLTASGYPPITALIVLVRTSASSALHKEREQIAAQRTASGLSQAEGGTGLLEAVRMVGHRPSDCFCPAAGHN